MELTKAEDTKKSCQEYTKELYKKIYHDPDNHDGVITPLELDSLECKVKSSIQTNLVEVMELQLTYFKS